VDSQVSRNTINNTANPRNPTVRQSSKHIAAPAMAPERVTPRTAYARTEKVTEAARASHQFPVFMGGITANLGGKAERGCDLQGIEFQANYCILRSMLEDPYELGFDSG
jgi:hypothetical protein